MVKEIKFKSYSNVGRVRKWNEDTVLGVSVECSDKVFHVFVVADGMGGGIEGKSASSSVCSEIKKCLDNVDDSFNLDSLLIVLKQAVVKASDRIFYNTRSSGISGTTCTVLVTDSENYGYLHIGDSRLYEVSDEELKQITLDDTYVQRELSKGNMTEDEAKVHPKRHLLTKAVGVSKDTLVYKSGIKELNSPLVLTSDGFSEFITYELVNKVISGGDIGDIATNMLDKGQKDNLSAIIVYY